MTTILNSRGLELAAVSLGCDVYKVIQNLRCQDPGEKETVDK